MKSIIWRVISVIATIALIVLFSLHHIDLVTLVLRLAVSIKGIFRRRKMA